MNAQWGTCEFSTLPLTTVHSHVLPFSLGDCQLGFFASQNTVIKLRRGVSSRFLAAALRHPFQNKFGCWFQPLACSSRGCGGSLWVGLLFAAPGSGAHLEGWVCQQVKVADTNSGCLSCTAASMVFSVHVLNVMVVLATLMLSGPFRQRPLHAPPAGMQCCSGSASAAASRTWLPPRGDERPAAC